MTTQSSTAQKVLRIITVILVGVTLITPWLMGDSMYFPYISAKGLFIRTMAQLILAVYIVLAVIDPSVRPKKSPLMWALGAFLVIAGIAVLTSANPLRSFWSNYERMEGYVLILHLAALFVVASSVVRRKEWAWIGGFSLLMSVIVGAHALGDINGAAAQAIQNGVTGAELEKVKSAVRISGKLGNSSYLGVYSLIHIFLASLGSLMIFRGNREEELQKSGEARRATPLSGTAWFAIIVGILLAVFNLFILYKTGTRGAFVGLVVGLLVLTGYLTFKERHKIIRYCSMGIFTAVIVGVVLLGLFKNSAWVQSSPQLARYSALISLNVKEVTKKLGEDRTMIWGMALNGVADKPYFGWGQDNFGYVFAKHYDTGMYAREHWFDRSHNVFLDWMIATGVLGFLSYLSFFVIAAWLLFAKRTRLSVIERASLLGLLAAYFVHNLFVFDNLSSYVLFFLLLAYIHDRYTHDRPVAPLVKGRDYGTIILGTSFVMLLLVSYSIYTTVYIPYTQNTNLVKAMTIAGQQSQVTAEMLPRLKKTPMDLSYEYFKKLYDAGTPTSEAFEQLSAIASAAMLSPTTSQDTKFAFYTLYDEQIKYVKEHSTGDPRYPFFISNFFKQVGDKAQSLAYAKEAYELSPNKESFAYMVAIAEIANGNPAGAVEYTKKAYENKPVNEEALRYYVYMLFEDARNKAGNLDIAKVGNIATILADAYHTHNQQLVLDPQLWTAFDMAKNKAVAKKSFATKLQDLIPAKNEVIAGLAK